MKRPNSILFFINIIMMATILTIFSFAITMSLAILISDQSAASTINSNQSTAANLALSDQLNNNLRLISTQNKFQRNQNNNSRKIKQQEQQNNFKLTSSINNKNKSSQQRDDPIAYVQEQIRLIAGYNNTPPVFATATRDFFVDISRQALGSKIATIQAIDLEDDQLEYSLKKAIYHDASKYFSINSSNGELRLANKQFKYYLPPSITRNDNITSSSLLDQSIINSDNIYNDDHLLDNDNDDDYNDDDDDDDASSDKNNENNDDIDDDSNNNEKVEKIQLNRSSNNDNIEDNSSNLFSVDNLNNKRKKVNHYLSKNLYYLIVSVYDGHQSNNIELQIHVINSTLIASSFQTFKNLPIQLAPISEISKSMSDIMQTKTNDYYDKLNNITSKQRKISNSNDAYNNSKIVYPSFLNPSITRPDGDFITNNNNNNMDNFVSLGQSNKNGDTTTTTTSFNSQFDPIISTASSNNQQRTTIENYSNLAKHLSSSEKKISFATKTTTTTPVIADLLLQDKKYLDSNQLPYTQAMIVSSAIIICSFLIILSLIIMFVGPISIKKLRKRLKNVEHLQHEHLSQRTSNSGSSSFNCSSACSTSGGTIATNGSSINHPNQHHHHHPIDSSLSQFTLTGCSSDHLSSCPMRSVSSSVCRQSSLDSSTTTVLSSQNNQHNNSNNNNRTLLTRRNNFNNLHNQHSQQQTCLALINNNSNNMNDGSIITNPVYLHEHNGNNFQHQQGPQPFSPQIMQSHSYQLNHNHRSNFIMPINNFDNNNQSLENCYNVYYPIDDDVYSTIQTINDNTTTAAAATTTTTTTTLFGFDSNNNCQIQNKHSPILYDQNLKLQANIKPSDLSRPISPNGSESGSSTRSLARFLSLPARHAAHSNGKNNNNNCNSSHIGSSNDFLSLLQNNNNSTADNYLFNAKTIARTSRVDREQQVNNNCKQQNNLNKNWEIERHKVKFINMLDKGQFGLVWKCKLKMDNNIDQIVAIKMLNKSSAKNLRDREELLAEIDIMKLVCRHPNVVKLLYCCTIDSNIEDKPILLIMEFVELGKLQKYLEKSRKNHYYATTTTNNQQFILNSSIDSNNNNYSFDGDDDDDNNSIISNNNNNNNCHHHITSKDLIKFIYHVSKGMEYLASKFIVHRDLASRNILVSVDKICKIGDFGMARHTQSSNGVYERHSRNTKIPVRWMAPEVLLNNRFTIESDVYSFGILMWEIVTLGSTPYSNLKTEQVIEEVARKGQRPIKPEYCHQDLYNIMSHCWSNEPNCRPTFEYLVKKLDGLLLSTNDYIELDEYPDHNYYNISEASAPNELL